MTVALIVAYLIVGWIITEIGMRYDDGRRWPMWTMLTAVAAWPVVIIISIVQAARR